jgi:4-amino-4-deoxy-L-arabinose transferase-like glycosyltransferase
MSMLLSRREGVAWAGCFLLVAALLVGTRFNSDDPDSALYAALSARLSEESPHRWIAPEWWGHWNSEGLFREHPVGVLLLPTILGALGIPGVQAAYIVGIATALLSLLILGHLIGRMTTSADGRLALVLLQLMPIAFIFRIRANHEYPMLLALLVMIVALDRVRMSWRWLLVPALALTAALLIKGVFVVILGLAAAIWIVGNPLRSPGPAWRAIAACAIAAVVMIAVAVGYDAVYLRETGERFWGPYWQRQLAPLTLSAPLGEESAFLHHLYFYLLRLLWHPAPWSFALVAAIWRARRSLAGTWHGMSESARRGLGCAVTFAAASIAMLTPASRFAERYPFSAHYAIAAAGVVVALYVWPRLRARIERLDRSVPAFPVIVWLTLMLLRLATGPLLPRISG